MLRVEIKVSVSVDNYVCDMVVMCIEIVQFRRDFYIVCSNEYECVVFFFFLREFEIFISNIVKIGN